MSQLAFVEACNEKNKEKQMGKILFKFFIVKLISNAIYSVGICSHHFEKKIMKKKLGHLQGETLPLYGLDLVTVRSRLGIEAQWLWQKPCLVDREITVFAVHQQVLGRDL